MPRPKGFEPFTSLWIVRWQQNAGSDEFRGFSWGRVEFFSSEAAANSRVLDLRAQESDEALHPAIGETSVLPIQYRNSKVSLIEFGTTISTFVHVVI